MTLETGGPTSARLAITLGTVVAARPISIGALQRHSQKIGASPVVSQVLDFNGLQYQLALEFGESTDAGLARFDEFHVLENESTTTKVDGTLVEIGTINFNR